MLTVFIGAHRGAVQTLVMFIGSIAAYAFASFLGNLMSENIYNNFLKERILENVSNTVSQPANNAVDGVTDNFNFLPNIIVRIFENFGLSTDQINSGANQVLDNASSAVANSVENAIRPVCVAIISMAVTILLFFVFLFFVRILARFINKSCSIPVIKQINRLGGGVIGFAQGIFAVFILTFILTVVLPFTIDNYSVFYENTIENTYIFKHIYNMNFLNNIKI